MFDTIVDVHRRLGTPFSKNLALDLLIPLYTLSLLLDNEKEISGGIKQGIGCSKAATRENTQQRFGELISGPSNRRLAPPK